MNNLDYFRVVLAWSMIVIVSWAVENWFFVIVSWAIGNNSVYFAQNRWLICDGFLGCLRLT